MASENRLEDSNSNLIFPSLPHESQELELPPETPIANMASTPADDADSLSSFNESAWDMIDERSAASEDEGNTQISRILTPMSETPEPIYMESESIAGNDTESEAPSSQEARFQQSRKDSSSDPPDTARPFPKAPKRDSISLEDQTSYIRFPEPRGDIDQEVFVILKEFHGEDRAQQCSLSQYVPLDSEEVFGTVRQSMAPKGISPFGPYKIMYAGPTEMKETIINKLASALATSAGPTSDSIMKSSRVTVVPISSFVDDSSPDVVLIDSMGIDMNIEVVESAAQQDSGLEINMSNKTTIVSKYNQNTGKHVISDGYEIPDLVVIYEPQSSDSKASSLKQTTRNFVRSFAIRHNAPLLTITYDTKWQNPFVWSVSCAIDERLPHLAVEKFNTKTQEGDFLRRQAIDINTFINIDSAQLSRSLALLNPTQSVRLGDDSASKAMAETSFGPTLRKVQKSTIESSTIWKLIRAALLVLVLIGAATLQRTIVEQFRTPQVQPMTSYSQAPSQALSTSMTYTATVSSTITSTVTVPLQPTSSSQVSQFTAGWNSALPPLSGQLNKTDKFQVKVVGDDNILVFAPKSFPSGRNEPMLFAKTTREGEHLPNVLSLLHNGVWVLQVPSEHAYGTIVITLWTDVPHKQYGSFKAELGSAWLRISGWQKAAMAMKDHLSQDFTSIRSGIQETLAQSNDRVNLFFKDAVGIAGEMIQEVETLTFEPLFSPAVVVEQTKQFSSKVIQSIRGAASAYNPDKFSEQHQNLLKDISGYSSWITSSFHLQAKSLASAASSITNLGSEIQSYRETHFVAQQRRLVQLYWNVFGMPERLKSQLEQKRQEMVDEDIWNPSKANTKKMKSMHKYEQQALYNRQKLHKWQKYAREKRRVLTPEDIR